MCTLTAGYTNHQKTQFRIAFNRDELRTRGRALPPKVFKGRRGGLHAYPIDSDRGGTWIGINDRSLFFALLNLNEKPLVTRDGTPLPLPFRIPENALSRGSIIPDLLESDNLEEAIGIFEGLDFPRFPPFRLIMLSGSEMLQWNWNTKDLLRTSMDPRTGPLFCTSSGLGDDLALRARGKIWKELLSSNNLSFAEIQEQFHNHRMQDNPELSVVMDRTDAITVSQLNIEIQKTYVKINYKDLSNSGNREESMTMNLQANGFLQG